MEELDISNILDMFWKKRLSICIIVFIFLVIGIIYSFKFVIPKYQAYVTLVLAKDNKYVAKVEADGSITQTDLIINEKLVTTYSELVKSDAVLDVVIEKLNLPVSISSLRSSISVTSVSDTELIKISVKNGKPELAKEIAQEVSNVFIEKVTGIYSISNIHIVDNAKLPITPYNINHIKDITLFTIVGVVCAVAYVFVINLLDNSIKSPEELEKNTKIKVLAEVPIIELKSKRRTGKRELVVIEDSKSAEAEAVKKLRTRIQYMSMDNDFRSLLITSTVPGEGKSLIAANLAISFAQVGYKVVLVDSDMRKSRQHRIFDLKQNPGLSNYLSEIDDFGQKLIEEDISKFLQEPFIENLKVLSAGTQPPNSSELLASKKLVEMIKELNNICDIIIFDGAPSAIITDSVIISRFVDSTIFVVDPNLSKKDLIIKVKKEIEEVNGKVSGIILNKVQISKNEYYKKYKYYENRSTTNKI